MPKRTDTRERVARLLEEGRTLTEIAAALGVSKPTVCFHKRRLGYEMGSKYSRRYDWTAVPKKRLIGAGLKTECCEGCGLTEWCGKPIPLQLHHVNGDGRDQRLENLQLLCANCHSQTDNWGGRNVRRRATQTSA
jgi:5-methylcytosine-specific restriction endonuclease McrA